MSLCSNLFFSTDDAQDTLFSRISLSENQVKSARTRKNELLEYIKPNLSRLLDVPVKHWLQGSYKNHTVIRPVRKGQEFDIDIGLYAICNEYELGALETKSKLRQVLDDFTTDEPDAELCDSKTSCERVRYSEGFHIDLPIYQFNETNESCRLASEQDEWLDSDPKSLQAWFDDEAEQYSRSELAQLRRVLKFLKAWTLLKSEKDSLSISSVALTVLVAQNFSPKLHDDEAFSDSAIAVCNHILANGIVENPCDGGDLLQLDANELKKVHKKLSVLLSSCTLCKNSDDSVEHYSIWSSVFEHLFPSFEDHKEEVTQRTSLPALANSPQIRARHLDKRGNLIANDICERVTAYKGETIFFSIANSDTYSSDSIVQWVARNRGAEASKVNDLGHQSLEKLSIESRESCEYDGRHYKDCIVYSGSIVAGLTSIKVVIRGFDRPDRNPPRNK